MQSDFLFECSRRIFPILQEGDERTDDAWGDPEDRKPEQGETNAVFW